MRPRLFLPQPRLLPHEHALRTWHANHVHRGTARGGTLVLSDQRLIFQPNTLEALIGRRPSTWPRNQLRAVRLLHGRRSIGIWKRRLGIQLHDGQVLQFVVWEPDSVAWELSTLLHLQHQDSKTSTRR